MVRDSNYPIGTRYLTILIGSVKFLFLSDAIFEGFRFFYEIIIFFFCNKLLLIRLAEVKVTIPESMSDGNFL